MVLSEHISGYLWNGFEMMLFIPWFEKSQLVFCVSMSPGNIDRETSVTYYSFSR